MERPAIHESQMNPHRKNIAKVLSAWAACLVALSTACTGQSDLPLSPATFPKAATSRTALNSACIDAPRREQIVRQLIEAINRVRTDHNAPPLRHGNSLDQIAEFYACRLVDGAFFAHDDPFDGSTVGSRASNFGYAYLKIGENLAAGQTSVEQCISDWMASPGHRANLLDRGFTEVGVGLKLGGELGSYWVVEFGRPITSPEGFDSSAADDGAPDKRVSAPASQSAP
jgi:uncharacterized protein YkwD